MRRNLIALVATALVAAAGFAAAAVAGEAGGLVQQQTTSSTTTGGTTTSSTSTSTTTTAATTTVTTTVQTTSTSTTTARKVTICHRTGSKKKPYRKITVSRNALKGHLRHGDILAGAGACPSTVKKTDGKGHIVKLKKKGKKRH